MFSNKKVNSRRRTDPPSRELSPRMARLLRESWWLLVAAGFVYLALTLVTYTKSDRAWSTTGSGSDTSVHGDSSPNHR